MVKRKTLTSFWGPEIKRNFPLGIAMGALFICDVYVYSIGATCLGDWGEVPGWVVFMSVDIITGNLWGLFTAEWDGAPKTARKLLIAGTIIILSAIIVVAIGSSFEGDKEGRKVSRETSIQSSRGGLQTVTARTMNGITSPLKDK